MVRRIFILLVSLIFVTGACAQEWPTAVFDVDEEGNADVRITEVVFADLEDISIVASVDSTDEAALSGRITDSEMAMSPDFRIQLSVSEDMAGISFDIEGGEVERLLSQSGDLSLNAVLEESEGSLALEASATVGRGFAESIGVNVTHIQTHTEEFKQEIEAAIQSDFAMIPISAPQISIDRLELTGAGTLTLELEATVSGWGAFFSKIVEMSYQEDVEGAEFLECIGLTPQDLMSAILGSNSRTTVGIDASGSSVSGTIESVLGGEDPDIGILSAALEADKSGSTLTMEGTATLADAPRFMSCALQLYMPGDYTIKSMDYSASKTGEEEITNILEMRIEGLAEIEDGEMSVSFPEEMTTDLDVVVNTPESLSVSSVKGGNQTDGGTAQSGIGEEFEVTYGRPEGGMDLALIAVVAAIIIVVLAAVAMKKRSSGPRI